MSEFRVKSVDVSRALAKSTRVKTEAARAYALAAKDDSNRMAPFLTGALRQSGQVKAANGKAELSWGGVGGVRYARPQYYAQSGWQYTTAGTGPRWFNKAKASRAAAWLRAAQTIVRSSFNG